MLICNQHGCPPGDCFDRHWPGASRDQGSLDRWVGITAPRTLWELTSAKSNGHIRARDGRGRFAPALKPGRRRDERGRFA